MAFTVLLALLTVVAIAPSSAHATVAPPPVAPYLDPLMDGPLGAQINAGGSMPTITGSTPTVAGYTYPGAWNEGEATMNEARVAARGLPALRLIGNIGLGVGAFSAGWAIGSTLNKWFNISGTLGTSPLTGTNLPLAWVFVPARTAADGSSYGIPAGSYWYLRGVNGTGVYEWGDGGTNYATGGGATVYNAVTAAASAAGATAYSRSCSCPGGSVRVFALTEAQMEKRVRRTSITHAQFDAFTGTKYGTTPYTPPSPYTAADLAAARAVMGGQLSGRSTTTYTDSHGNSVHPGDYVDTNGDLLTQGQVVSQTDTNCALDASYCSGGANDPNRPGGPTSTVVIMPNCVGLTWVQCRDALEVAGFTVTPTRAVLSFAGAVVTKPAAAVVTQSLAAGAHVDAATTVTITTNPDAATMPLLIPAPMVGESAVLYRARLQGLGVLGTVSLTVLPDGSPDPSAGPNEVVRTNPRTATRVLPGTDVLVVANPASAPDATGDPSSDDDVDPGEGASPFHAPAVPALDMTPITHALDCTPPRFPFGIPCWTYSAVSSWVTAAEAPNFCMPFPFVHPDPCIPMDLWDDGMPIVRAMLLLMSVIGLGWMFMRAALGFGGGGGDED